MLLSRWRRIRLVALVALTACSGPPAAEPPVATDPPTVVPRSAPATVTDDADDLTTHTIVTQTGVIPAARRVRLTALRDTRRPRAAGTAAVTVATTWAARCVPCTRQEGELTRLVQSFTSRPPAVALVAATPDTSGAQGSSRSQFRLHVDRTGELRAAVARLVPVTGAPVTVVLDDQHRIAAVFAGLTSWRLLAAAVTAVANAG